MPFNLYIYAAVGVALLGLVGTTYVYKLKFDKAQIQQEVAEQQRDTMLEVNMQILAASAKDAKLREKLYGDFKTARDAAETYRQKLAKHNLSALAQAKPGLITIYARRATDRVLSEIETTINNNPTETVPGLTTSGHSEAETTPANSSNN